MDARRGRGLRLLDGRRVETRPGDQVEAFEADLRQALLAYDPSGVYREDLDCAYVLARRP